MCWVLECVLTGKTNKTEQQTVWRAENHERKENWTVSFICTHSGMAESEILIIKGEGSLWFLRSEQPQHDKWLIQSSPESERLLKIQYIVPLLCGPEESLWFSELWCTLGCPCRRGIKFLRSCYASPKPCTEAQEELHMLMARCQMSFQSGIEYNKEMCWILLPSTPSLMKSCPR